MSNTFIEINISKKEIRESISSETLSNKQLYKFLVDYLYHNKRDYYLKFIKTFNEYVYKLNHLDQSSLIQIIKENPSIAMNIYDILRNNYATIKMDYDMSIKNIKMNSKIIDECARRNISHNSKIFNNNMKIIYNSLPSAEYIKSKVMTYQYRFTGSKEELKQLIITYLKSGFVEVPSRFVSQDQTDYTSYYIDVFKSGEPIKEEKVISDFGYDSELLFYLTITQRNLIIEFKGIKKFDMRRLKDFPVNYLEIINNMSYDEIDENLKSIPEYDIYDTPQVLLSNDMDIEPDTNFSQIDYDDTFIMPMERYKDPEVLYRTLLIVDNLKRVKTSYNEPVNVFNVFNELESGGDNVLYNDIIDYTLLSLLYEDEIYLYKPIDSYSLLENYKSNLKFDYVSKINNSMLRMMINPSTLNLF